MKNKQPLLRINKKQRGFTLFEYCAGAAVILGVVWTAMSAMGTSMSDMINAIAKWTSDRAASISGTTVDVPPPNKVK